MATHAQTRTPMTIISDSQISIDTLNVDKTTTIDNIVNNLPLQKQLDFNSYDQNLFSYNIFPYIKEGFEKFVLLFVNGDIVPRLDSSQGNGFYISNDNTQIFISGSYQNLINETSDVTIFYTTA